MPIAKILIFDENQIRQMTRRIAQLGEMHDHSALEELLTIGKLYIVSEASLKIPLNQDLMPRD